MKKALPIALLLLLPLIIAELLGGSSPPVNLFKPSAFIIGVMLYGCGALLIREAQARWKLQWSVIFLAIAYGIVEEGLMTKAFFNPLWVDLRNLPYDFFGIQWAKSANLSFYHATISTLVPITMVDLLFPEHRGKALLKKGGLGITLAAFIAVTLLGFRFMKAPEQEYFYPPLIWTLISILSVLALVWLAHKLRNSRMETDNRVGRPWLFGILGFLATFLIIAGISATNSIFKSEMAVLVYILLLTICMLLFMKYQIYNRNTKNRHIIYLNFGMVLFLVALTPFFELKGEVGGDPADGYAIVGAVALILLIAWRRKVLALNK